MASTSSRSMRWPDVPTLRARRSPSRSASTSDGIWSSHDGAAVAITFTTSVPTGPRHSRLSASDTAR